MGPPFCFTAPIVSYTLWRGVHLLFILFFFF